MAKRHLTPCSYYMKDKIVYIVYINVNFLLVSKKKSTKHLV